MLVGNFADEQYKKYLIFLPEQIAVRLRYRALLSTLELQTMSRAACFLYTSHHELFGLTPLEANACCTAVVAIGEGGVRETILNGVNGYLVVDNDAAALAEHVLKPTLNLNHATELGAQARQHVVRHWSASDAIDRMKQHMLQLSCYIKI